MLLFNDQIFEFTINTRGKLPCKNNLPPGYWEKPLTLLPFYPMIKKSMMKISCENLNIKELIRKLFMMYFRLL